MINFSSDYHIGTNLSTHTTHASRAALKDALFNQAMKVTDQPGSHYIGGDLVNSYKNDESTIHQALTILSRVTSCLMGNHDVTNRADSLGTMELLEPVVDMVPAVMNQCVPQEFDEGEVFITMVPHTNTQGMFETTLYGLGNKAMARRETQILVLHCNYELPWESNETTLNLTEEMAKKLLEVYDLILIGHEHNHRKALGGRVILMGNIHPTNFGDISDKYRWEFEDGVLSKVLVWSKDDHYIEIEPFSDDEIDKDIQFIKVIGNVDAADYPKYCRWLADLWKANDQCYAIRNAVEIIRKDVSVQIDEEALQNLTDTILGELEDDKPMYDLFNEILGEL